MKDVFIVFIALFLFFISCNDNGNDNSMRPVDRDTSTANNGPPGRLSDIEGCYLMIQGKDTATLGLAVVGMKVSGNLQYRRFEKDNNVGTISGTLRDSLIQAFYVFQSEGMTSVREVVFLVRDSSLLEAYGEIVVQGDTAKFVNISGLKFLPTPFVKIDCENR